MTETTETRAPSAGTAGALLRQARQAQGLHIAALAAAIKVTQRKLELLEADRFDQLPDATFTRALAKAVCRHLKIDPTPVLALLPPPNGHRLEQVAEGLNTPFREHGGRMAGNDGLSLSRPAVWVPLLVVIGAGAIYFMPARWLPQAPLMTTLPTPAPKAASAPTPSTIVPTVPVASSVASEPATIETPTQASAQAASEPIVERSAQAAPEPASPTPAATAASGVVVVQTTGESWIEVVDARNQTLISRVVKPGEPVGVDGAAPMKVKIGNARVTQLSFRGKAVDLAPYTRDNIARLELKQSVQP